MMTCSTIKLARPMKIRYGEEDFFIEMPALLGYDGENPHSVQTGAGTSL